MKYGGMIVVKFTIVIPVKNGMPMLEQTLESVCNQKYENFDIIIPLGTSNDNSEEIIRKYQAKHNLVIIPDCNDGIFSAMNLALDFCENSYVCFLGAGDIFISDSVLNYVSKNLQKTDDWTVAPWVFFDSQNHVIANPTHQDFGIKDICKTSTPICHQTVFMHSNLINSLSRFNLEYVVASDRDLIVRAWLKRQPVKLRYPIAGYLDGGFSAKNHEIGHRELKRIQGNIFKQILLGIVDLTKRRSRIDDIQERLVPFEWLTDEIKDSINEYSLHV
jgi:glycosyltransferase involved in cell wall biosynthesis